MWPVGLLMMEPSAGPRPRAPGSIRPRTSGRTRDLVVAAASTLVFLLAAQVALPALAPLSLVYDQRLRYDYFKDNHANLDVAILAIKEEVHRESLRDYIIILGDSVAQSARSTPDESLAACLQEVARAPRVFCLAQPSMQMGDIYTVVLKLKAAGLSTGHLVINLLYAGFVAREPYPPVVFWLEPDLRRLDPVAYAQVAMHLQAARLDPALVPPKAADAKLDRLVVRNLYPEAAPLAYRDFTRSAIIQLLAGQDPRPEVFDPRPWTEKPHLPWTLRQDEYQRQFRDKPFVMDDTNPQVYFIERLLAATSGDQVLFFLSPVNQALMRDNVRKAGYQVNLGRVDAYFGGKRAGEPGLIYLNLEHAIPNPCFADHLHLTGEGHRLLAELLWEALNPSDPGGGT